MISASAAIVSLMFSTVAVAAYYIGHRKGYLLGMKASYQVKEQDSSTIKSKTNINV